MKALENKVGILPELENKSAEIQQRNNTIWTTTLAFECFGVKIGILATAGLLLDELRALLPPSSNELKEGPVDKFFKLIISETESILYENDFEKLRFPGNKWVSEALRGQLKSCVSQFTAERVFIHAGVVAHQDRLILIPGEGFSGKTTLTAELVKAGAIYYSDDFAILDQNALVYPYPKPLSLRQKGANTGEQTDYDVGHFGGVQGINPLPVSLVVITEYQARARWRPQTLTPGEGVLEILRHTNNSLRQPQFAVEVLQKVVIQAKIIKSKRGEAEKAARAILQEC
ncbi:MAG: hypothetical protein ABI954_14760 [Pyrinomonadaceae bacterium]